MRALVSVVSLFFLGIQASDWSYTGDDGLAENQWPEKYPDCGGKRQSPINVKRRKVRFNRSLKPLLMVNYDVEQPELSMTNNGHTVQITLPHSMHFRDSDGTVYVAEQMHFHWGGRDSELSGSEHTFDGMRSMMEVHYVHFNQKYETFEKAKDQKDGLAVLAVLVEVKEYAENTYYSTFISEMSNVKHPGQTTTLKNVNIRNMLPVDIRHYYTYNGSLTTPSCTENVKWFVLRDFPTLSKVQAVTIENSVMNHNNKTIQNGYRSTQPLNNRVVEANFPYSPDEYSKCNFYVKHKHEKTPYGGKQKRIYSN
ncbi:carbonic anhydrase 6 [Grammomys surdaster]|uniref:carbonic anhydrase 6 n=1 Tax=Grammomys surdaster TaxID=491861 RepID=UPI0010A00BA7|nr:carbonic anhydrase 6 [Grammomys surdaster]